MSTDPLSVRVGQNDVAVSRYSATDTFTEGQIVWYCEVRGTGYIRTAE